MVNTNCNCCENGCLQFTIVYPNGGTEKSPANVSIGKRYLEENPFPGYFLKIIPQVLYNGKWGNPRWSTTSQSCYGVAAEQLLPDDKIVIQVGDRTILCNPPYWQGHPLDGLTTANLPLPCRLYVEKGGRIPNLEIVS